MPFTTSQNPGMTQAANSLAKIFVGDPAADAAYRDSQIKNETEYVRQQHIAAQALTEGVRQKKIEQEIISEANRRAAIDAQAGASRASAANSYAGARANKALASGRERENTAYNELGTMFTTDQRNFNSQGGMSVPGDAPAGTPGAGINLQDPATASRVAGIALRGGIDPKNLGALAIIPGQTDETLGHIFTAGGKSIGKDDYVSTGDRNTNRNYELGAGERLVGGDGSVKTGVDQSYIDKQGGRGGAGKVPKLGQQDMNSMIRSAILARGGALAADAPVATYFAAQPELYSNLSRLIAGAWDNGGGNAAAVQDMLGQYLGNNSFEDFGKQPFAPAYDVESLLQSLTQNPDGSRSIPIPTKLQAPPGAGINPDIFTGGAQAPLPNRQSVGNGGWTVRGVRPGGQ